MTERVQVGGLQVAKVLHDFINQQAIPGSGVDSAPFWSGFETLITDLAPKNKALLTKRSCRISAIFSLSPMIFRPLPAMSTKKSPRWLAHSWSCLS